jgi:hypothetical protein
VPEPYLDLWFLLFYCLLLKFFFSFSAPFRFFLNVLLSFLLLLNWFLFLSSFVFPLLFRHCFIPVSLALVISSLAYPNLLGTKRLGCCCCCNNSFLSKCFTHLHVDFLFAKSHVLCCLFYKISPRGILISPGPGIHFHWY